VRDCTEQGRLSGQATREQDLRSFLGSFNFTGDQVKQAVGSMSGGEKARLVLCMIVWQRPNLLLLDEPTNHLDLATREALSMALNEFEGTVMLVSHDRALLRAVCDEFWLISRGGVAPFDGDLDDYQRYLLDMAKQSREAQRQEQREQQREEAKPTPAAAPADSASNHANRSPEQRKLDAQRRQQRNEALRPLKKELEQNEKRMAKLAKDKAELEATLAAPATPAVLADAGRQLKAVGDEVALLEGRWLELTEQIESNTE
jgi:ATP-binding cassette, subfamily F, member 3